MQHNILLLGSGGRENALAWKIAQSPLVQNLYIAPGNPGTAKLGKNVDLTVNDFDGIIKFCKENNITILVPGPEDPLVNGIYDAVKSDDQCQDMIIVGPTKAGAVLEGSKAFSKKLMMRHGIPTASYAEFTATEFDAGVEYLKQHSLPIVLKADGLAAGKGVIIANNHEEAIDAFTSMIKDKQFGTAGDVVVVEQFLDGVELSVFALCNGENYILLPEAKDYKRIGEGDQGLNTGGMGAISPVPFADETFLNKIKQKIVEPTLNGLVKENIHYQGFLFFGLIKVGGEPMVIEYNCRMGDPETEVVMPRLESDIVELFEKMANKSLNQDDVKFAQQKAATVMVVSGGYPGDYEKGKIISNLELAQETIVFHAGTTMKNDQLVTSGGRVIALTSLADSLQEAVAQSINMAEKVTFQDKYYRTDIGYEFK